MARRRNSGVKGSIYKDSRSKKLIVKVGGKKFHTGLDDSMRNRDIAERIKERMYYEHIGLIETGADTAPVMLYDAIEAFRKEHYLSLAAASIRNYDSFFTNHTPPNTELTATAIDQWAQAIAVLPLQASTRRQLIQRITTLCNYCIEKYGITAPRIGSHRPKVTEKEIKIFKAEEMAAIIRTADDLGKQDFALLMKFMLQSGARIGETVGLRWESVKSDRILFSNKIKKTLEYIPLSNSLKSILDEVPRRGELVFAFANNKQEGLRHQFDRIVRIAEVEQCGRSFHTIRKTFLYNLFRAGVPVQVAQRLMRHKSINVTIKFYTYFDDSDLLDCMNRI